AQIPPDGLSGTDREAVEPLAFQAEDGGGNGTV
ncbi:unnamed protein product, partial [marine sediment metagenome]